MEVSTADLVVFGGALISAGVQLAAIASQGRAIRKLEAGARSQGARLEDHKTTIAVLEDRMGGPRRRVTTTALAPVDDDPGASDDGHGGT